MTNELASWSPATNTAEISRFYRGPALFDALTVELLVPGTKPDISTPRRWSRFARFLTVLVTVDVVGAAYVFVTTR